MHQILFKDSNHIILEQKVESKIYCNKENHCKNQYDRYCTICEDYYVQVVNVNMKMKIYFI